MSKIIEPVSTSLIKKWSKCVLSFNGKDNIKTSFYPLKAINPIFSYFSHESTSPVLHKPSSFTLSSGLASKYLDVCEADSLATPTLVKESLFQLTNHTNSNVIAYGSPSFMSPPSMVNRFLDECDADRECYSPSRMASLFQDLEPNSLSIITATTNRPKPLPRRVVLLRDNLYDILQVVCDLGNYKVIH